ncbi:MFS transporter [Crucibulum laeve]|uniref:MFS transporter n=1 Tax=Crucibulum laeve TaxID=68775 RepID=A0A5C3MHY9_9AGAR|nr:MFS transporter [Crucibulum laeve]
MSSINSYTGDRAQLTKRILWKLDCHILPPLALLWLCNFIDRSNIGNARIAGLERDAHLHGNQFNTALAVFYASYLIVELPSNIVLKKMRANRWIPMLVGLWGVVTTLTALVHNFSGLLAIRIFLGLCEGGLLPGMILYLSTVYKRHELQLRVGIFYASASLSGAFGGLLATAITKMDGIAGLAGWRWIYILEGIATVLSSFIAAYFLPADISSATFLTEEERSFALWRFRSADTVAASVAGPEAPPSLTVIDSKDEKDTHLPQVAVTNPLNSVDADVLYQEDEEFEWREVMRGIFDIQTWLTGMAYFGLIVSLYSYSLFLPTIVSGLGYSGGAAQLHTVPPYVPAAVLTVVVAFLSDRLQWRGPFILICLPFAIIGYILAITAETNTVRYIAVFFMAAGVYPSGPCILSILPNNSSGHYKKATTTALQLAVANSGGFVATFAYTADQAPKYVRGHTIALAFVSLAWVLVAANVGYCMWENKARREGRRAGNLDRYRELRVNGKTRAPIGDRHPDFRFTL